jgi:hypothetical protein
MLGAHINHIFFSSLFHTIYKYCNEYIEDIFFHCIAAVVQRGEGVFSLFYRFRFFTPVHPITVKFYTMDTPLKIIDRLLKAFAP